MQRVVIYYYIHPFLNVFCLPDFILTIIKCEETDIGRYFIGPPKAIVRIISLPLLVKNPFSVTVFTI